MIISLKKHRIFIIISIFIIIVDSTFVALTYNQAQNNLHYEEQKNAINHFSAFDIAYKATEDNMLQIANIVAHTQSYRDLFSQGKAAVAIEGGGGGQEKSAEFRNALNDAIQPTWQQFVDKFHARQLHFHLGPGATSFLRVHKPLIFGDNLGSIRHTIVDSNRDKIALASFETGRAYSGIRGISPVSIVNSDGEIEHVGVVEAGASFSSVLNNLTDKSEVNAAIFLYTKHLKGIVWSDYFTKRVEKYPPINDLVLEETTSQVVTQLEKLSRKSTHRHSRVLNSKVNIQILELDNRQYLYMNRPLRDYIGNIDAAIPDAGKIVIWEDVTDLYAIFNHNFKVNIFYALFAFLLIEILLFFAIRFVKNQLNKTIEQQTVELTSRSSILEQLAQGVDLNKILESLALIVEHEIPHSLCCIQLLSKDGQHLLTGAAPSIPTFFKDKINGIEIGDKSGSCGIAAYKRHRVIVEDIQSHPYCKHYKKIALDAKLVSCWSEPIFDGNNQVLGVFSVYYNTKKIPLEQDIDLIESMTQLATIIIERKKADEELQLLSRIYDQTHDGIVITNKDGVIVDINPIFSEITGYQREDVMGKRPSILSSGQQSTEFYVQMWESLNKSGHWKGEVWNRKKNGEVYAEFLTISSIQNQLNITTHYVGSFTDITKSKEQQKSIEVMAHYDLLTQLPNRTLFIDRFNQAIAHSKRNNSLLAICFLDLDGFKPVNDMYGHDVGDKLLIQVSGRITASIREEDTVSRQGGDEFAILLGDLDSPFQGEEMLKRLNTSLALPYIINEELISISASIGVALYPHDSEDLGILLRHADQAMYKAKLLGKNRYQLFNREQDKEAIEKQILYQNVKKSLNNDEFALFYQPKVNMKTGEVYGVEALIRWIHPEKGVIPPLTFLPIIEGTDLEYSIGEWVILEALQQLDSWISQGIKIEVSVNISSNHIQSPNFYNYLNKALAKYPNIPSKLLQLEILESSALGDLKTISDIINTCKKALGVNFALDDFGTGYSSLTHLRNLSVDTIKIDQSFVRDMLDDPNDYSIIEGVIGLADAFNRKVIAEGVESVEHGIMLLVMGCYYAQGYSIAKPMPAGDFSDWLNNYKPNKEWMIYGNQNRTSKENKIKLLRMTTEYWLKNFNDKVNKSNFILSSLPILEYKKCHHGAWIQRAKQDKIFDTLWLNKLEVAHENMHKIANLVIDEYQENKETDLSMLYNAYQVLHVILDEYK